MILVHLLLLLRFFSEGVQWRLAAVCREERMSAGSLPGRGMENALRRGRTRERQEPSQVCVAPCTAQHAALPTYAVEPYPRKTVILKEDA